MKYKFSAIITLCLCLSTTVVCAGMIKQIEVNSDPDKHGMRDFTFRIRPEKTHDCDEIIIKCFYLQQFPWENLQGEKYIKKYEPTSFTYRAETSGLTAGLDKYISFRVPVSLELLQKTYGNKLFNAEYPVSIGRFEVSGMKDDKVVWHYDLKSSGGLFKLDK